MPVTPIQGLVLLAAFAAALWLVFLALQRRGRSRAARFRAWDAADAERRAERILHRAGYRVEDRQLGSSWTLWVDGEVVEADVRADLLVSRRGRRYVAEVKSGRDGARPSHPHTRRQLLEYRLAFDCDGVLLVDMLEERIVEVDFPEIDFE